MTPFRNKRQHAADASPGVGAAPPEIGEIIADKYRVEAPLGRGGMGVVFRAIHLITGKRFAIKWLLPDPSGGKLAIDRFIREAQVAGRVEHPNIVEVYDVGKARGSFYMVMELLEGESLEARFLSRGAMPVAEVIRIMLPCARGVARAHAAGIVHRDLKPANIFLRRAAEAGLETPKVLDFGISKMADTIDPNSAITKTGTLLGTPFYMAPEQVHAKDVDARTDVYAFGVILYQLVAGRLPFEATTYSSLLVKILTELPKPLESVVSGLPTGFGPLVRRAMAREPGARFQTIQGLISALEQIDAERHGARHRPRLRAPRWRRTAILAAALTAAAVAWMSFWRASPEAPRPTPPPGHQAPAAEGQAAAAHATQAPSSAPGAPAHAERESQPLPRGIDPPSAARLPASPPAPVVPKTTRRPASPSHVAASVPVPPTPATTAPAPPSAHPRAAVTVPAAAPASAPEAAPAHTDPAPEKPTVDAARKPGGRLGVQLSKDEF